MDIKKCCLVVLAVLCLLSRADAQDFKTTVLQLRQEFEKSDKLHVLMKIKAFEDESSVAPFYAETGEVKRSGTNYLYRFGEHEMLMNEKYLIVIDKESREIAFSYRDHKSERHLRQPMMNIDSLLSPLGEVKVVTEANGLSNYQIAVPNGEVSRIDFIIDSPKKQLKRIQYHYAEGQFVTIDFEIFDVMAQFEISAFDEAAYVQVADKNIRPSKKFSSYQIVNSISEDEAN